MEELTFPLKLIISFIIGAVIGLERESYDNTSSQEKGTNYMPHLVGVRTFSLITTLGTLSALLLEKYLPIFILFSAGFLLLVTAYYILNSLKNGDLGITTELALIYAYFIGFLIATELISITVTVALSVVLVLVLARKHEIKKLIGTIYRQEINAFLSYALIALVILPFLPNQGYVITDIPQLETFLKQLGLSLGTFAGVEIINPFKLWLIVALITGIDMAGYLLERTIGQSKGRIFSSIIGGFVSSTAATLALAQESKTYKATNRLVSAATFANVVSFVPLFALIASINATFFTKAAPALIGMMLGGIITGYYFYFRQEKEIINQEQKKFVPTESQIFSLVPALKFALVFLIIRIATQISLILFGQSGFFATSALAALTGLDAVVINIAQFTGETISSATGVIALMIVNAVNLSGKLFYSYLQGKQEFTVKFSLSVLAMILFSLSGLFFI